MPVTWNPIKKRREVTGGRWRMTGRVTWHRGAWRHLPLPGEPMRGPEAVLWRVASRDELLVPGQTWRRAPSRRPWLPGRHSCLGTAGSY